MEKPMSNAGPWYCDACGKQIESVEDGMVGWLSNPAEGGNRGRNLQLVHNNEACNFDGEKEFERNKSIIHDWHLKDAIGSDGLTRLLNLLCKNKLPALDVCRMIMRLQIPGYDLAYRYAEKAIDNDVYEPNLPPDFLWTTQIAAINKWIPKDELG